MQVVSDPDRAHVEDLLKAHDLIDVIVPRGGRATHRHVRQNATMPVVAHGDAVVQIYIDEIADIEQAVTVVDNAKTRRYSICNAVDTLLVHEAIAPAFLEAHGGPLGIEGHAHRRRRGRWRSCSPAGGRAGGARDAKRRGRRSTWRCGLACGSSIRWTRRSRTSSATGAITATRS